MALKLGQTVEMRGFNPKLTPGPKPYSKPHKLGNQNKAK